MSPLIPVSKVAFNGIATVGAAGVDKLKPTFFATNGSFSFAVSLTKYNPLVEIVFADEKCIFKLLPLGVDAGAQSENVKANSFWFLAITVLAVVPASVTVIGSNKIEKSALFPPLIVQVVSLIAPEKEIIPPALLVAANATSTI